MIFLNYLKYFSHFLLTYLIKNVKDYEFKLLIPRLTCNIFNRLTSAMHFLCNILKYMQMYYCVLFTNNQVSN